MYDDKLQRYSQMILSVRRFNIVRRFDFYIYIKIIIKTGELPSLW